MFGGVVVHDRSLLDHKAFANCIMHGRYEDGMLAELLHQHHIHIVAFPGDWMETYGYCLSRVITAGTPIVYRNMGCLQGAALRSSRQQPLHPSARKSGHQYWCASASMYATHDNHFKKGHPHHVGGQPPQRSKPLAKRGAATPPT
jgi:hypothetical protein